MNRFDGMELKRFLTLSAADEVFVRRQRRLFVTLALVTLLVLFAAVQSSWAQSWLFAYSSSSNAVKLDRPAEWESSRTHNLTGLEKMRSLRAVEGLHWDEHAEQYFLGKLHASQFPKNCSEAHWIAHYEYQSGLLSSLHLLLMPLLLATLRGHPLIPISGPHRDPAFDGCGPDISTHNMQCLFTMTSCNAADDPSRMSKILAAKHDNHRTSWEELLMEDDAFFRPGGVTVSQTYKRPTFWDTKVCVAASPFSTYLDAYNYQKYDIWAEMGRQGKAGVVKGSKKKCASPKEDTRARRVDMLLMSLMSSWMLNQMPRNTKLVAEEIMSKYLDVSGQPLWKAPVLAVHIRQTDKAMEDPYFGEHGTYRPISNYAVHVKKMEEQYGFEWPTIFIISDSGTAMETFMTELNGKNFTSPEEEKRFIMYDWTIDDHIMDKYGDHSKVPKELKHDMQIHFLAELYIVQKIADHAIVTYSSNVGRFIGEIMAAKHRLVVADPEGPLVTSLDHPWYWG